MAREYTNKLLEMLEEGLLDKDTVIMACVKYMSEDDVKDMMEANELLIDWEGEEEGFSRDNDVWSTEDDDEEEDEDETFIDVNQNGGKW
jgi:hypothetical protein